MSKTKIGNGGRVLSVVFYWPLAVLILVSIACSNNSHKSKESSVSQYGEVLQKFRMYAQKADYQGIIDYSNALLSNLEYGENEALRLLCLSDAAQCYIKTDWPEKAKIYLDSATACIHRMPRGRRLDSLYVEGFYTYCNAMMMHYIYDKTDYREAIKFVSSALDTAKSRGDLRQSIIFGINYTIINTQIQSDYAYEMSEKLHQESVKLKDSTLVFQTAQLCAWRFSLLSDYSKAKEYMEIAVDNLPKGYMDVSVVYADYANILYTSGQYEQSEIYFDKALSMVNSGISSSALPVYLSYAEFQIARGNEAEAEKIYRRGISLADSASTRWNLRDLYHGLYRLLVKHGKYQEAISVMESYIDESETVAKERQRKDLIELRIKYETAVKEKIIEENERKLAQQKEKISVIALVVVVCTAIMILFSILYFRKRASYRTLFRLYSDMINNQRNIRSRISSGDNKEKYDSIFNSLDGLMRNEHLYRDAGLTIEKAACIINTNRTYLSSAIKHITGLSFVYYINSYRIKEAVELLSDPENNTPMKAIIMDVGFKSPTVFYRLFSEVTGKTPQTYRNDVKSAANTVQIKQL